MTEIWKAVVGYEDSYEVSNTGKVRSLDRKNSRGFRIKGVTLRPATSGDGYLYVALSKNNHSKCIKVHRLVAKAFVNCPEGMYEVNHKDGDKLNNSAANLEWSTRSLNVSHAYSNGLKKGLSGERNPMYGIRGDKHPSSALTGDRNPMHGKTGSLSPRSKTVFMFDAEKDLIASFGSGREAERKLGVSSKRISYACITGKPLNSSYWSFESSL